jgi:hypothetical protein
LCRRGSDRFEECSDYNRIKLNISAALNLLYGFRDGHCGAIWSVGSHSIKGIGHSDDPRSQGYVAARYDLMKSGAVIMIVVVFNDFSYFPINHRPHNVGTDLGMSHNVLVFFTRQAAGLILDNLINGDLPNVVKQTSPAQVFHVLCG